MADGGAYDHPTRAGDDRALRLHALSGPLRLRQLLPEEAEALLQRRVAFYNVWRPLKRTVEEKPLAMCDVASTSPDDMLKMVLRYRERTGEIYVMRHSSEHKWWYFPRMTPEHALY